MKTLPEGALPHRWFNNNRTNRLEINLLSNPWHCSCELDHLKKLFLGFPNIFSHTILCNTPIYLREIMMEQIDLCHKQIYCHSKNNLLPAAISKSMGIYVDPRNYFMVTLNTSVNDYYLIWFETTTTTTITNRQCITIKKRNVSINQQFFGELKQQNTYIFCMMTKTGRTVSPIDCMMFTRKYPTIWVSQNMQVTTF